MSAWSSMGRNALGLALFAVLTVGAVAVTETLTRERIETRQVEAERALLYELLGASPADPDLDLEPVTLPAADRLGLERTDRGWRAFMDGEPFALITPVVAPDGYSGPIRLLLAVAADGRILGVRTVSHRETPGLGDLIELRRSDWILDFDGRRVDDPVPEYWTVRPEGGAFDAFTGATITPRAVIRSVHRALGWYGDIGAGLLAAEPQPMAADEAP